MTYEDTSVKKKQKEKGIEKIRQERERQTVIFIVGQQELYETSSKMTQTKNNIKIHWALLESQISKLL